MPAGPLDPHPAPLTPADARHLVRRLGFGAPNARVAPLVGLSAAEAVRRLLDEATAAPAPADPAWYTAWVAGTNTSVVYTESENVLRRFVTAPVREKLTLFWHNHFAAEAGVYSDPRFWWQYYALLRAQAFGNARTLVREVGLTGAMLRYLNGNQNTRTAPNQNYARELLELFTTGPYAPDGAPNYTGNSAADPVPNDVTESARALTGWRTRQSADGLRAEVYFTQSLFDTGAKTFLGQTGPWGYDDVVRIVFERRGRAVAHFLARKLLAFYVTHTPRDEDEAALADVLVANAFAVRPTLDALFGSAYFFGQKAALVKAPLDLYVGLIAALGVADTAFNAAYVRERARERGEYLFNPPDVAGWDGRNPPSATGRPGFAAWYESDDFGPVWDVLRVLVANSGGRAPSNPLALLTLAADPDDPFVVARALAEAFLAVPLGAASVPPVEAPFAGNPAVPLPAHVADGPAAVVPLTKLLLGGTVPHYEWAALPSATRTTRLRAYLTFLTTELPEFLVF